MKQNKLKAAALKFWNLQESSIILLTVLSFNLLGDGLRDALDPKLKK